MTLCVDVTAAKLLRDKPDATEEIKAVPRHMRTSSNPAPGQPFGNVENRRCTE
jgi:hypothetical protein